MLNTLKESERKMKKTTENATQSTMKAVKRAKAVVVYDAKANAKLVSVTHEDDAQYKLANKKTVDRESAVANVSKNRFNTYTNEDNTVRKSYHSHVDFLSDVNALFTVVQAVFEDATQTQYFVFARDKEIKFRIQKNAVEVMCKDFNESESEICTNAKDVAKYGRCVSVNTLEQLQTVLEKLKTE